jgi:type IV pilus assembly protein PilM
MNLRSLFTVSRPNVAVGIWPDRVAAVAVSGRNGGTAVAAHAFETLPPRALDPQLTSANMIDRAAVLQALQRVFERLGHRPRRVAVAVPDTVAKVSLLRFEKVPARADDLDQLIRFQLRKAAPFKIEEGQVSWSRGVALEGGGREFVVVLARRDVVREYESVCEDLGAHAGLVDLSTLGVIDGVVMGEDRPAGDWLLVHVTSHYATVAIMRGGDVIFYRNRGDEGDGDLAGLVHQTAMYYEDRLSGQRFGKVLLVGTAASYGGVQSGEWLRRTLEERLGTNVDVTSPGRIRFADRATADPSLVDFYSPLIGLLQR